GNAFGGCWRQGCIQHDQRLDALDDVLRVVLTVLVLLDAYRDFTRLVQEHADIRDPLPNAAGIAQVLDSLTPELHGVFVVVLHNDLLEDATIIVVATADNPGELQHLAPAALDIDDSGVNNLGGVFALWHQLEGLATLLSLRIEVEFVLTHFPLLQCWVRVSMLKSKGIGSFSGNPYRFFAAKAGRPSTNRKRLFPAV